MNTAALDSLSKYSPSGVSLARAISRLQHGVHACLVYDTPEEQLAAVVPFLQAAIARGDRCVYVCDETTTPVLSAAIAATRIPAAAVRVVPSHDVYLRAGRFDPTATIALLRAAEADALGSGCRGLAVTGDTAWALDAEIVDRLIAYETLLNDVIPGSRIVTLCQYNGTRLPPAIVRDAVRTHPAIVVRGHLIDRNPYFEPAAAVIGDATERDRVGWMLGQLETFAIADRARTEVERLREEYARIVESSPDAIVAKTLDGTITSWNPAAERQYGYSAAEAIGRPIAMMEPVSRHGEIASILARIARGDQVRNMYTERVRKDGSLIEVSISVSPMRDAAGSIVAASTIARDVTDQRRAERVARDAEASLRRRESALREAEQIAHLGNWTLDIATGELVWSDEIYRIFEIDPEAFGASYDAFLEAIHPDDRERVNAAYTAAVEARTPYDIVHRLLMKDGRAKYVHERARTIYRADGAPLRSIGTVQDITEAKKAEDAVRAASIYARSLLEASLDPLVTISPAGQITDVNNAAVEATGVARDSLIGTDFADYFTEPARARAGYEKVLEDGFVRDYPLTLRHTSGRLMEVIYNAAVYRSDGGALQGVFAAARDVTERVRAERALQELNRDLERRVDARTSELKLANRELEAFSYSVSHDLRAPLRALKGFSRILTEEYAGNLGDEPRHYLDLIGENAGQMGRLIDDLLAFSRLSRQPVRAQPVVVTDIVDGALAQLAPDLEGRRVDVHVGPLPRCQGDPALLRQVFVNLLSNALKFTRRSDPAVIDVSASADPAHPGHVVYTIADNGVGFDMRYASKLFEIFQRLHPATEYEGTGVGLAIVQRIVHRHGGRIWADGTPGRGARFSIALPEAKP